MGFEFNYDNFVGLSFGFFMAFISVRLGHELGNGLGSLRRYLRRRNTSSKMSA